MSHNHHSNPPPGYSSYRRPPPRPPQISKSWSAPPLAPTPSVPQSVGKGFRPILQTHAQGMSPPSSTSTRGPPVVAAVGPSPSRSLPHSVRNSPSPSESDHGRYSEIPDQIQVSATLIRARKVDPFALKLDRQAMPPVVSWVGPSVISTLEPVKRGDTIIEIDGVKPKSQRDAKERITKASGTSLRLLVRRDKTVLVLRPPPKSPLDANDASSRGDAGRFEGRSALEPPVTSTTTISPVATAEPQRVRGEKAPRVDEPRGEVDDLPRLRPLDQAVRRPPQESSSDWDSDDEREVAAAAARRAAAPRTEHLVDISRKGIAFGVDFLRKQRERASRRQDTTNIQLDDQPVIEHPSPHQQQYTATTATLAPASTSPPKVESTPTKAPTTDIPLCQAYSSLFVEDVVTSPQSAIVAPPSTIKAEPIDVDEEEEVVKQWGTVVEGTAAGEDEEDTNPTGYHQEAEIDNGDGGGPIIYDSASSSPKGSATPSYSPDRPEEAESEPITATPAPTAGRRGILDTPPRAVPLITNTEATLPPPPAYRLPPNASSHPHTPTNPTVLMFPPPPPNLSVPTTPNVVLPGTSVAVKAATPSQHTSATPTPPPAEVAEVAPSVVTAPSQLYLEMIDMLHQPTSSAVDGSHNKLNSQQYCYQHFMDVYDSKTTPQPCAAPTLDKYGRRVYNHCAPALRPPTPLPTSTYLQHVRMSKHTAQATSLYHFQLSCVAADLFTATTTPATWRDQHFKGVGDAVGLEGRLPGSALSEKLKEADELVESVVIGLQHHPQYTLQQISGGAASSSTSIPLPPNPMMQQQPPSSSGVGVGGGHHMVPPMGDGHQYGKGKNQTKTERKLAKKEIKRAQREARNFFTGALDSQQRQQQRGPEDLQYFSNMFSNFFNPNQ